MVIFINSTIGAQRPQQRPLSAIRYPYTNPLPTLYTLFITLHLIYLPFPFIFTPFSLTFSPFYLPLLTSSPTARHAGHGRRRRRAAAAATEGSGSKGGQRRRATARIRQRPPSSRAEDPALGRHGGHRPRVAAVDLAVMRHGGRRQHGSDGGRPPPPPPRGGGGSHSGEARQWGGMGAAASPSARENFFRAVCKKKISFVVVNKGGLFVCVVFNGTCTQQLKNGNLNSEVMRLMPCHAYHDLAFMQIGLIT